MPARCNSAESCPDLAAVGGQPDLRQRHGFDRAGDRDDCTRTVVSFLRLHGPAEQSAPRAGDRAGDGFARGAGHPPAAARASKCLDDNVDHFTFDAISSPQVVDVPFSVTVLAVDILNNQILVYSGTAALTGSGESGSWRSRPRRSALPPGHGRERRRRRLGRRHDAGSSQWRRGRPARAMSLPSKTAPWQPSTGARSLRRRPRGALFAATVTAEDANGFTVTGFTGTATLSGLVRNGSGHVNQILVFDDSADNCFQTRDCLGNEFFGVRLRERFRIGAWPTQTPAPLWRSWTMQTMVTPLRISPLLSAAGERSSLNPGFCRMIPPSLPRWA